MKTNTTKTIAALLGSALILTSSVLAGPDPQNRNQGTRATSSQATVETAKTVKPLTGEFKSAVNAQSNPHLIYTAHGGVLVLL